MYCVNSQLSQNCISPYAASQNVQRLTLENTHLSNPIRSPYKIHESETMINISVRKAFTACIEPGTCKKHCIVKLS